MDRSFRVFLTDELRVFVEANSGGRRPFAMPTEFVRALLCNEQRRQEAARFRQLVLEGYEDLLHGRVVEFEGDLDSLTTGTPSG